MAVDILSGSSLGEDPGSASIHLQFNFLNFKLEQKVNTFLKYIK